MNVIVPRVFETIFVFCIQKYAIQIYILFAIESGSIQNVILTNKSYYKRNIDQNLIGKIYRLFSLLNMVTVNDRVSYLRNSPKKKKKIVHKTFLFRY